MSEKRKFLKYYKERIKFLEGFENQNPYTNGMIVELNRIKEFVFYDDFEETKKMEGAKTQLKKKEFSENVSRDEASQASPSKKNKVKNDG